MTKVLGTPVARLFLQKECAQESNILNLIIKGLTMCVALWVPLLCIWCEVVRGMECDENYSCQYLSITEGVVRCGGLKACNGITFNCNASCEVYCSGDFSCLGIKGWQSQNSTVTIHCTGPGACGGIERCKPPPGGHCHHNCTGMCACVSEHCDLGSTSQQCEMAESWKTIDPTGLKCRSLSSIAMTHPYPADNIVLLLNPTVIQVLYGKGVLNTNTTELDTQMRPFMNQLVADILSATAIDLDDLDITFKNDRLIIVQLNNITEAEIVLGRSLKSTISLSVGVDMTVTARLLDKSTELEFSYDPDSISDYLKNENFIRSLFTYFIRSTFSVMEKDILIGFEYSASQTQIHVSFPSGCPVPRPFFESYCSGGRWIADSSAIYFPDYILTQVYVQNLLVSGAVNIESTVTITNFTSTPSSALEFTPGNYLQLALCPTFDGTLSLTNTTLGALAEGIIIAHINSTCEGFGHFTQISTNVDLPSKCLKPILHNRVLKITISPDCQHTDNSVTTLTLTLSLSIGITAFLVLLILALFKLSPTFQRFISPWHTKPKHLAQQDYIRT